jgi:molybdate transport system regulatory protein
MVAYQPIERPCACRPASLLIESESMTTTTGAADDAKSKAMVLTIRIAFGEDTAIGPGKIKLMELIDQTGSISAAGRAMDMSYRRAWLLVDDLNHSFRAPVIMKHAGGSRGGGAELTELGRDVIRRYRRIEQLLAHAAAGELTALQAAAVSRKS